MTLTDRTAAGQSDTIAFDIDLRHAPDKVWRALTEPKLLTEWLLPIVRLRVEPGSEFTFQAPPQPGWDGTVHCRVLEVDAPRTLRYAWTVGDLDTVVTFTLAPTVEGTRLSLVQSGFREEQKRNFGGARYGWRLMGGRLAGLLDADPS